MEGFVAMCLTPIAMGIGCMIYFAIQDRRAAREEAADDEEREMEGAKNLLYLNLRDLC